MFSLLFPAHAELADALARLEAREKRRKSKARNHKTSR